MILQLHCYVDNWNFDASEGVMALFLHLPVRISMIWADIRTIHESFHTLLPLTAVIDMIPVLPSSVRSRRFADPVNKAS
jgi:hypothetical protein